MFLPLKFRYQFAVLLSVFLDSEFMLIKEIFISHSKIWKYRAIIGKADRFRLI